MRWGEFEERLSEVKRREVEVVARVMTVANRCANTLDALVARRSGAPAQDSRLLDEVVIAGLAGLMILAVAPRMMRYRKASFRGILRDLQRFSGDFET